MESIERNERAENRADVVRVLMALALLAFLSTFDGASEQSLAANVETTTSPSH